MFPQSEPLPTPPGTAHWHGKTELRCEVNQLPLNSTFGHDLDE